MMHFWLISITILLGGLSYWLYASFLPSFIKTKAQSILKKAIFPEGKEQKRAVLEAFHSITSNRLTDEQLLDYFYKIKGLQNLNVCEKTNFWVKKYLLSPTDVKLNYFEQVKFYEVFINYPKVIGFVTQSEQSNAFNYNNENIINQEQAPATKKEFALR